MIDDPAVKRIEELLGLLEEKIRDSPLCSRDAFLSCSKRCAVLENSDVTLHGKILTIHPRQGDEEFLEEVIKLVEPSIYHDGFQIVVQPATEEYNGAVLRARENYPNSKSLNKG